MAENFYPLDRANVTGMTFEQAGDHTTYWKNKTQDERLNGACFIINQIYGVNAQTKVDKNIFDKRQRL